MNRPAAVGGLVALVAGGAAWWWLAVRPAGDTRVPSVPLPSPAPVTPPAERAPEVAFAPCTRTRPSPAAVPADPELARARERLAAIVSKHTGDPLNPWAIVHGLIAQGPDMVLSDGKAAIPWLFETYAERVTVGTDTLVAFPRTRKHPSGGPDIRIEPHTDLILKAVSEVGVPMEQTYLVQGQPATLGDLYRHSLWKTWVDGPQHSFRSLNDSPWTLQGLASAAPPGLAWTGQGGHPTTIDAVTDAVVADLAAQNAFLRDAMASGATVKKERQGIFAYTCGGQHLLQGAAHAVARGFGSPASREAVQAEIPVLFWRMGVELGIYDTMIAENPEYKVVLLEQRLKFVGHFLESAHKLAAYGLYTPDAAQTEQLAAARRELVATVDALAATGALEQLHAFATDPRSYQMYLDFVGDSAHALRGIDLATGAGTVCY